MKRVLARSLIWFIENLNRSIEYFKHDIQRGSGRKTVAVSIVLILLVGFSLAGTSITGQITRAKETAADLSSKLGEVEAKYQKLSVDYDLLQNESQLCAEKRDEYLSELNSCEDSLSEKTTNYNDLEVKYDICSVDLEDKTDELNSCSSDLDDKTEAYDSLKNNYDELNNNHDNLKDQKDRIVRNVVTDYCCTLTTATSVDYTLTDKDRVKCFVTPEEKTGTVQCP